MTFEEACRLLSSMECLPHNEIPGALLRAVQTDNARAVAEEREACCQAVCGDCSGALMGTRHRRAPIEVRPGDWRHPCLHGDRCLGGGYPCAATAIRARGEA